MRLYDLQSKEYSFSFSHKGAVLDCCFGKDVIASGGIDKNFKITDLATGSEKTLGTTEKAIKSINYHPELSKTLLH